MDFFTTILISAKPTESIIIDALPADEEKGSSGGGTYCVVSNKPPADEEKGSSGGGTYCVVA